VGKRNAEAIIGINYKEVHMTSVSFDGNRLSCSATTYSFLNSKISIELPVRI